MTSSSPPKKLSYISPTSFMLWRENPIAFWLKYMAPPELKPLPFQQTPQMAVGNVFDTHIKYHLASTVGRRDLPADMLEKTVDTRFLGRRGSPNKVDQLVLWEGLRAYWAYRESPALRLMMEDIVKIEMTSEQVRMVGSVPIWGKPDAEIFRHKRRVIPDWKVSGAFAHYIPSAEVGWAHRFVERMAEGESKWVDEGPHHRSIEYLETLQEKWAIQLAMYSWLLGDTPGSECFGQIDKVLLLEKGVEVYVYKTTVGRDFQLRIYEEMKLMWAKVLADEILPIEFRGAPPELLMTML